MSKEINTLNQENNSLNVAKIFSYENEGFAVNLEWEKQMTSEDKELKKDCEIEENLNPIDLSKPIIIGYIDPNGFCMPYPSLDE